jgi:hypothetical protein
MQIESIFPLPNSVTPSVGKLSALPIMSTLPQALATLANYRKTNTRASRDVFDKGFNILKSNATAALGDDGAVNQVGGSPSV